MTLQIMRFSFKKNVVENISWSKTARSEAK